MSAVPQVEAYEALVEDLRGQVDYLRDELRHERERHSEADRENRRIIAGLIHRVPELGAAVPQADVQEPLDGRDSAGADTEGHGPPGHRVDAQRDAHRPDAKPERGFWSRLFGG